MTKTRKILAVLMCLLTLLIVCCNVVGCSKRKYDVSIKIACSEVINGKYTGRVLETFIFKPGVDEMHIERKYDGREYRYYVYQFNLPCHPQWSQTWFTPNDSGDDVFQSKLMRIGQKVDEESPKTVCERGEYCKWVYASNTSTLWKSRSINLYIKVI